MWGFFDSRRHHNGNAMPCTHSWAPKDCSLVFLLHKLPFFLLLFVFLFYFLYTYNLLFSPLRSCLTSTPTNADAADGDVLRLASYTNFTASISNAGGGNLSSLTPSAGATGLQHIVFGIAASAKLWEKRKAYIKVWWRPRRMRGFVWLDEPVTEMNVSDPGLPELRISGNTTRFPYTNRKGSRSAIRISRIVSETFRLGLPNVRWFVMGDDDTVFLPDNLARVLSRFDHRQPYYIGSLSESHIQNIHLSYCMAYGGGGFAISASLAAALSKVQDRCLHRYPALYGSDDRIQACMAELGVPLTRHSGFHQFDIYGDLLGLLASHPVAHSSPSTTSTSSSPSSRVPRPALMPFAASSTGPSTSTPPG
ncbi:hypothetical protein Cni_G18731 [Canna indica]|uniref:Uncharacterized protein n=1 Tax=Canna indica TaxID=4628 RepID=A0AAQ3KPU9_9LILI|nr:hypothetical protein Cni_G18731 [Canna indica]